MIHKIDRTGQFVESNLQLCGTSIVGNQCFDRYSIMVRNCHSCKVEWIRVLMPSCLVAMCLHLIPCLHRQPPPLYRDNIQISVKSSSHSCSSTWSLHLTTQLMITLKDEEFSILPLLAHNRAHSRRTIPISWRSRTT